ncbi:hypothetical protein EVAR_3091_1 [Eumeta japonica]|uniref:Uncharacterized protein n=1 Tax=Eumeta variegata TaxID=151549 RepID=A0A4C1SWT6_EUMVA|nr:hypothetical protein EVAR_3091_1 [Eumeta japonica]
MCPRSAAFATMNTEKKNIAANGEPAEIAFLQWLLYMQIPSNKSRNPSLLALCGESAGIQRFMYSRIGSVLLVSGIDSVAVGNSEVKRARAAARRGAPIAIGDRPPESERRVNKLTGAFNGLTNTFSLFRVWIVRICDRSMVLRNRNTESFPS